MMSDAAFSVPKALSIREHLRSLMKDGSKATSDLEKTTAEIIEFVIFAYDDLLSGSEFVGNKTAHKMREAYQENMMKIDRAQQKLAEVGAIRSQNVAEFRANLDAYIAANNIDIDAIRQMFD